MWRVDLDFDVMLSLSVAHFDNTITSTMNNGITNTHTNNQTDAHTNTIVAEGGSLLGCGRLAGPGGQPDDVKGVGVPGGGSPRSVGGSAGGRGGDVGGGGQHPPKPAYTNTNMHTNTITSTINNGITNAHTNTHAETDAQRGGHFWQRGVTFGLQEAGGTGGAAGRTSGAWGCRAGARPGRLVAARVAGGVTTTTTTTT